MFKPDAGERVLVRSGGREIWLKRGGWRGVGRWGKVPRRGGGGGAASRGAARRIRRERSIVEREAGVDLGPWYPRRRRRGRAG